MGVGASFPERLAYMLEGKASEHEKDGYFEAGIPLRSAGRVARTLTDSQAYEILTTMGVRGSGVLLRRADLYGKSGRQVLDLLLQAHEHAEGGSVQP